MNGPEITAPTSIVVDEDSQNNTIVGLSVSDADGEDITVTISAEGLLSLGQTTGLNFTVGDGTADGTMTFTGSAANINAALAGLVYSPAANDDNGDSISISVTGTQAGSGAFSSSFDLADLLSGNGGDGSEGFVIEGADGDDESGWSVSNAGDVNGDGIDDLIIGAIGADPDGDSNAGESYVVFGSNSGFSASLDLGNLNGSNGFTIKGVDAGDQSGWSVSNAGDLNNDGIDDLIIGAKFADAGGDSNAGEAYVVFGANSFGSTVDLASLNGSNGFTLSGIDVDDFAGVSVSAAGDVNGDGIDDIIIGADFADGDNTSDSGESYVVFGKDTSQSGNFSSNLDLSSLNGTNGFVINGATGDDHSGTSVSAAGDINGDGIGDLVIGAYGANDGMISNIGKTFVVFGTSTGFASGTFNLSTLESGDGSTGFVIIGEDGGDVSGSSVSNAGDVNGDGIDDLIIGAEGHDSGGDSDSGASYVVFGTDQGFSATIDLGNLNGSNGFKILGIDGSDESGFSVSAAGDVNGDGVADLIIGAPNGDNGASNTGEAYVVFGRDTTEQGVSFSSTFDLSTLSGGNGANGFIIEGIAQDDFAGFSVSAAGDVNGDGIDDLIVGARAADGGGASDAGQSFVIFGRASSSEETVNETITVNINPLNDAPTISGDQAIAVNEGGSVVLTIADFVGADIDDALTDLTYSVSSLSNGTVQVGGLDVTSFTHTQLINGDVSFVHDGTETTTGSFNVLVEDDDSAASSTIAVTATVAPQNDAPTISGDQTISVNEGQAVVLTTADFAGADVDDTTAALTYSVTGLTNGTVQVNGVDATSFTHTQLVNGDVTFLQDGTDAPGASFDVSVSDDDNASSSSITISATVINQNDAPTISGDQAIAVDEGASVVLTTADFVGTDVDDTLTDLSYEVSNLSNGTVQVNGVDATSFTHTQLANGDVTFLHDGSETTTGGFDIVAMDDDFATSSAISVSATVTPTNDAPTKVGDQSVTVVEGQSVVVTTADFFGFDVDDDIGTLIYRISNVTNGEVQVNGTPATVVTFLELISGSVTFVHDGSDTGSGSFDVVAEDDDGAQSDPFTVTATVTPVNDAPSLSGDQAIAVDEGNAVVLTTTDITGVDVDDTPENMTFTVTNLVNGDVQVNGVTASTFTQADLEAGIVTFLHDGSETISGSFDVSLEDDDNASAGAAVTVTATVNPVNDVPEVSGDLSVSVGEGARVVITTADLNGTDGDHLAADLTYTVSSLVNGAVHLNGAVTSSFTQADLEAGLVEFVHDGTTTSSGSFDVVLADIAAATSASSTISVNVTGPNVINATGPGGLFGTDANDVMNGTADKNGLVGGAGNDILNGEDGNDNLLGDEGDDTLNGGAGSDNLVGGAGADSLDGGAGGSDKANYRSSTAGVTVNLANGTGSGG